MTASFRARAAWLPLSAWLVFQIGISDGRAQSLPSAPLPESAGVLPAPPTVPSSPITSLITFAPAHAEMGYFLRVQSSDGAAAECYTPCTLPLPAGPAQILVLAPRTFQRDIVLTGKPSLVKLTHASKWRYGVGGLLLGISLAEFIYGAVYFPWTGEGTPFGASVAAAAWAFGALELTSAITLLSLGGKNRVEVIDDPKKLKAENPRRSSVRLARAGAFATPSSGGFSASFRF